MVGRRLLMLISMWLDDADDPAGVELVERLATVGQPNPGSEKGSMNYNITPLPSEPVSAG
jgi:hypothetical protein